MIMYLKSISKQLWKHRFVTHLGKVDCLVKDDLLETKAKAYCIQCRMSTT